MRSRMLFKVAIGERVSKAMNVKYAFQQLDELPAGLPAGGPCQALGTCHAVLAAKDLIDGPFAVINADDYYGPEAFRVMGLPVHPRGRQLLRLLHGKLSAPEPRMAAWPAAWRANPMHGCRGDRTQSHWNRTKTACTSPDSGATHPVSMEPAGREASSALRAG